jgi:hypothetical protein
MLPNPSAGHLTNDAKVCFGFYDGLYYSGKNIYIFQGAGGIWSSDKALETAHLLN